MFSLHGDAGHRNSHVLQGDEVKGGGVPVVWFECLIDVLWFTDISTFNDAK